MHKTIEKEKGEGGDQGQSRPRRHDDRQQKAERKKDRARTGADTHNGWTDCFVSLFSYFFVKISFSSFPKNTGCRQWRATATRQAHGTKRRWCVGVACGRRMLPAGVWSALSRPERVRRRAGHSESAAESGAIGRETRGNFRWMETSAWCTCRCTRGSTEDRAEVRGRASDRALKKDEMHQIAPFSRPARCGRKHRHPINRRFLFFNRQKRWTNPRFFVGIP